MTTTQSAATVDVPVGRDRLRLVLVLGALVALGPLTIDMYLPALPTIVSDLGTTDAAAWFDLAEVTAGDLPVASVVTAGLGMRPGR